MILFWHFRYFSLTILSLSLSLIRSRFSPMLTNTCNLMHGFKLLFSNWTLNTCEEAYMSILSIRRHLTFLRLHTLCSKLLSCCCFYCHYDAYKSVSDRFPITPYVSFRWYIFFENINCRILYESTCFTFTSWFLKPKIRIQKQHYYESISYKY